jgi:short-subunit dehydrogenase
MVSHNETNKNLAITGCSGSIATEIIKELKNQNHVIYLYSRNKLRTAITQNMYEYTTKNYLDLNFPKDCNKLLITNGQFNIDKFQDLSLTDISSLIESNFTKVVEIIHQFLNQTNKDLKRDIYILGSSASYDLNKNTSIYGSSKLALRGFVSSMNKELNDIDTRLSIISTGTINNAMGRVVPNQIQNSLINESEISKEIIELIYQDKNYFEPEINFRRRFMQSH